MGLPVLRRDALALERCRVLLDVRQKLVQPAKHALEVQDEVRTLLVRDRAVRIVGVLPRLEVDDEPLVPWPVLVLLECVLERFVADEKRKAAVGGSMEELEEKPFDVGRPAFIEPEVGRVCLTTGTR